MRKKVAVFGSTGSIGLQSLDIISQNPELYELVAISANTSVDKILEQIKVFQPLVASLAHDKSRAELERESGTFSTKIMAPVYDEMIEASGAEIVVNALMGAAGLSITRATLEKGLRLGLANKESLIMAGELVMPLSRQGSAELIPVDSEHSAIFQCLVGERASEVNKLWITASGGPFRGKKRSELSNISPEQALAHPTWSMGAKISIDSSTLMNKGLEVIEAHFLFDVAYDDIAVIVQPQSIIHSMVEFSDASVKAHLGVTDMRIPIQYALSYPKRGKAPLKPLDFYQLSKLDFERPDLETFGCLKLAYEAGRKGGCAPTILNAANEIAVDAFLGKRIAYLDIERLVYDALSHIDAPAQMCFEQVLELDQQTRKFSEEQLSKFALR